MTRRGRPLRFLLAIACGWVGGRVVILWPRLDSVPALIDGLVPAASAKGGCAPSAAIFEDARRHERAVRPFQGVRAGQCDNRQYTAADAAISGKGPLAKPVVSAFDPIRPAGPATSDRDRYRRSRWSGSAWLLARGGNGISSGVIGGRLGGSQAGIRLAYMLDPRRRVALAARLTSPLGPGMREASVGIEWQPTRLPVRLVAEQRIAIAGGCAAPGVAIVGGAGLVALGGGFRLDGYGQTGVIKRDLVEGYVDGAVHVAHPLASVGGVRLDLGSCVWSAAQRGARRVDLGPSLGAVVPIGKQTVRLSLDWRERVAGRAAPGSGIALTLGADF